MPKVTIAYVTSRKNPHWEWFFDSLAAQTTLEQRANLQIVVIDGHLWRPDAKRAAEGVDGVNFCIPFFWRQDRLDECKYAEGERFPYVDHIPPLPCAWQGPFRQTTRDFFCAGNQRNTAFIIAQHPYVVFVDDLSVLMPGWFNQVLHAAQDQYVVCGAYKKVHELCLVSSDPFHVEWKDYPAGVDSRWHHGSDGGVVPWHGSGMFGCSFGVPLEAALEVDGNDCALLGQGAEDTDFGIRLERAGWPFFYNRNMLTLESEELHHDGSKLPQERKLVAPECLPVGYEGYRHVNEAEKYQSDHVMLNRLINEHTRYMPIIGDGLRAARERFLATGLVAVPQAGMRDWRTGGLLSSL